MAPPPQIELTPPPGDAISSIVFAPQPGGTRLLVASWDRHVHLYDVAAGENGQGALVRSFELQAPVLTVCFGATDQQAFASGLDGHVIRIDLDTGDRQLLGTHSAAVKSVVYSKEHALLFSASWDLTLQIFNLDGQDCPPISVPLPGKIQSMSASPSKLVVAMAARLITIYDLDAAKAAVRAGAGPTPSDAASPPPALRPWQERESSLKFLTRAIACMPNDAGYATSSIEGRVAVEWFEDSAEQQARKYAFKCHRLPMPEPDGGDMIYPVNALVFHPVHGTFASAGGDGTVALWDADAKRRLKQYQKFSDNVAALAFSADGRYLAVAVCPGFETGQEHYTGVGLSHVLIRELTESEAKGKESR